MRRRTEFEKDMRCTPPSPRFSRTFDLLLSRFPDSADSSANSNNTSPIMASNRSSFQSSTSDERPVYIPTPWRSTVSAPACVICNKSVYPAEETIAAGQKFHKLCLKCTTCNTLLNPGNANEHEKKIYCLTCHRRQFGPHGVGRGLGTTTLTPSLDTPPTSPSLNQEEDEYNSTLINTNNDRYQRKTSTDSSPSHASSDDDSRHSNPQMNNTTPFSGGMTTRQTMPTVNRPTSTSVTNGTAFKAMSISGNICPRCSKAVYLAEEVKAAGKSFHKRCYTCVNCKGSISGGRYCERDGELYDNNCYQRLFGPRGVGFGVGSGTLSTGN